MPIAKHHTLITVDGVKDLRAEGAAFRVRYERVGTDGRVVSREMV